MGGRLSHPEVDLKDKVAIVTGGNNGIGYATSKSLAFMGAHVIIACRSTEKGQQAIESMKDEGQAAGKTDLKLECMKLDLSSLQSTKQFIEDFKQKNLPLHIYICNAGIFNVPQGKTEDNLEQHFQVNYLGHFLICLELLPCMLNTDGDKRIVLVSSGAVSQGVWDPSNLQGESGYARLKFYGNSKLYMLMEMYALQRRLKDTEITVSGVDPGFVKTGAQKGNVGWIGVLVKPMAALGFAKSPDQGAMTSINCAVNQSLNTQQAVYYANCRPTEVPQAAINEQYQEELWRISCDLLKDWMSPETWSKYSRSTETTATAAKQESGNNDGVDDQPTTTTDMPPSVDDDKPPEGDDKPPEGGHEDKPSAPAAEVTPEKEDT